MLKWAPGQADIGRVSHSLRHAARLPSGRRLSASCMIAMAATAAILLGLCAPAPASVSPRIATLEDGTFSAFDQVNTAAGSLTATRADPYEGAVSARATFAGDGAANGYSRGVFNVGWVSGDDVHFGAAYFLPVGFKAAMQGGVSILRWDNYPSHGSDGDIGGVSLYYGDKRAHVFRGGYNRGYENELVPPFELPEGRWFWLELRQRFGTTNALTEVYLDGNLIGQSTAPNSYGRTIERVRYGIVSEAGAQQVNPLTLFFDRATISTTLTAPVSALPELPPLTTTTATTPPPTGTTTEATCCEPSVPRKRRKHQR